MQNFLKIFKRREFYLAVIVIAAILVYAIFFKPNPWVRVNTNRLLAAQPESALTLEAPEEVDGVGQKFMVRINVDTLGNSINAVQSYLTFDPNILEITSSNTGKSFCKFYPENNYDNNKGLVKLACGAPYPGFRGKNILEELEFNAKAIQTTTIKLTSDSMVLANDGKGTNLLQSYPEANIKIKAGL